MAAPSMAVRVSANIAALRATLELCQSEFLKTAGNATKLSTSLDGSKLQQRALEMAVAIRSVGGAATLSGKEAQNASALMQAWLEKAKLTGKDVPPMFQQIAAETRQVAAATEQAAAKTAGWGSQLNGLLGTLGVGFGVMQLKNFGKELLYMGDELVRVADRTGLTTEEVQRLSFIAQQSGNTIDDVTTALSQMQKRLALGDTSALSAVKALHLSFAQLRAADPYSQIEMISAALAKVSDPAARAALAFELFGRSGTAILPTLTSHFNALGDAALVMSDKTVRALNAASNAWQQFELGVKVVAAESYNYVGKIFDTMLAMVYKSIAEFYAVAAALVSLASKLPGGASLGLLGLNAGSLNEQSKWYSNAADVMVRKTQEVAVAVRAAAPAIMDLEKATHKAADRFDFSGKAIFEAAMKAVEGVQKAGGASKLLDSEQALVNKTLQEAIDKYRVLGKVAPQAMIDLYAATSKFEGIKQLSLVFDFKDGIPAGFEKVSDLAPFVTDALKHIEEHAYKTADALKLLTENGAILFHPEPLKKALKGFDDEFVSWVNKLPQLLEQAFTGGGGVGGAIKAGLSGLGALVGKDFGTKIAASIGDVFATTMAGKLIPGFMAAAGAIGPSLAASASKIGQTIGSAITGAMLGATVGMMATKGAMVGGLWGAAIGAGVGAIYGVIKATTGPGSYSQAYKDWKAAEVDANQKYADTQLKLTQTYGSLQQISEIGSTIGVNLYAAMTSVAGAGGQGTAGLAALNAAADEFAAKYKILQTALQKYTIAYDDLTSEARQRLMNDNTQAILTEADALAKYGVTAEAILRKMAPAYDDLIQSALRMGDKLPESMRPMIEQLVKMDLLSDATKRKLLGLADVATAPDFATLQGIAQKYNMDVSRLGAPYAQLSGNAGAGSILADYKAMVAAGIDSGRVIEQMQHQLSPLVASALQFGTTLPAELRPLIEASASWGQILDAQGNVISDISGLKWADAVVDPLQAAMGGLDDAIANLFDPIVNLPDPLNRVADALINLDDTLRGSTGGPPGAETASYHLGGLVGPWITAHGGAYLDPRHLSLARYAHHGLSVGDVPIIAQAGEGILSRDVGMPAIGGRRGLEAANRGQGVGGGYSGPSTIIFEGRVDKDTLVRFVVDNVPAEVKRRSGRR